MKVDIDGPARSVFMRSEQYKFITGKNVRVCHTPIKSTWRLLRFEFKSIHMTDINSRPLQSTFPFFIRRPIAIARMTF